MKKYWELQPNDVQVEIKNQSHLDELFEMCELFCIEIEIDTYKSNEWFMFYSWSFSNYDFNEDKTEVTTEQFYEILCHNYGYKGKLRGFDKEVVLKMLEYQEERKNKRDIKEFEDNNLVGFDWSSTEEGYDFWKDTIFDNKGKFPDQQPISAKDEDYKMLYYDLLEKFNQLKKIIN